MLDTIYKIACVIVTFNRKELLMQCIEAVLQQSFKPIIIYIIDNASTDGTTELLYSRGYLNSTINGIYLEYIKLDKNTGGAGGFYTGIKKAAEEGIYDGIWVMDDDGIPHQDCLKNLIPYIKDYDYIAPLVVSKEDKNISAFYGSIKDILAKSENGIINKLAAPFNGILYSKSFIEKVGYPKKEMFIWGDEYNYHIRALKKGIIPITIINAIHTHPKNRQQLRSSCFNSKIVIVESNWKLYCLSRNITYNAIVEHGYIKGYYQALKYLIKYSYFYLKNKDLNKLDIILNGIWDGILNRFNKLDKYFI